MLTHILVPLDGSRLSELALPMALELASRFESQITLLRVVQPPHIPTLTSEFTELITSLRVSALQETADYLQLWQDNLQQQGYLLNTQMIEGESVAELILQTVNDLQADIIVMSTHGRGGVKRWVYGSVADKVLRHAQVPVLLIRAKEEPAEVMLPPIEDLDTIRSHENT